MSCPLAPRSAGLRSRRASRLPAAWNATASDFAAAACACGVLAAFSFAWPALSALLRPASALLTALAYVLLGPTGSGSPELNSSVLAIWSHVAANDSASAAGARQASVATPAEVGAA